MFFCLFFVIFIILKHKENCVQNNTRKKLKTPGMKNKESKNRDVDLAVGTSAVVTSSKRAQMYLWGWMEGQTEERERGGVFFLVLLFVTPLKMYMGITSKLVNRKHPLAMF